RAEADVIDAKRLAALDEQQARVEAERQRVLAEHARALAQAQALASEYQARQDKMLSNIVARERHLTTSAAETQAILAALAKEKRTIQADLLSKAKQDLEAANARLEEMRAIRKATQEEGTASIEQMRESAQATRDRAAAVVRALSTEADSVLRQTQADVKELENRMA